jgi:hypothetical protein
MSFDVLRDPAKMAQVDQWLAEDAAEKQREDRERLVTEYLRRFIPTSASDREWPHTDDLGLPVPAPAQAAHSGQG